MRRMIMSGINKLTFPLGLFLPGSVVKIRFPFQDDPSKYKERPAVVIQVSPDKIEVIMLKITSHAARGKYDYTLRDAAMANLKNGSVVRCNHMLILPGQYKCESVGSVSTYDFINITTSFNVALSHNDIVSY